MSTTRPAVTVKNYIHRHELHSHTHKIPPQKNLQSSLKHNLQSKPQSTKTRINIQGGTRHFIEPVK